MRIPSLLPILILGAVMLSACGDDGVPSEEGPPQEPIPFDREGTLTFLSGEQERLTIDIEIAETDSARTRGLMQRESMPEKSGMLFIFDQEQRQSFWMANTPLSLDLFFVGADSQIVDIAKYAQPYSSDQIVSDAPAKYVVETIAGFADTYGLTSGDRVTWTRISETDTSTAAIRRKLPTNGPVKGTLL